MDIKRVIAVIVFLTSAAQCYKPVIFMHGLFRTSAEETKQIFNWLEQRHPGTKKLVVSMFEKNASLTNMNVQVDKIKDEMLDYMKQYPEGVHILCYSQGGLVCRGVLEQTQHNVDTFISLSSPQAGQFGVNHYIPKFFANVTRDLVYKLAYSKGGQLISVANYWNDPHHQDLFRKYSKFLPVLNNDTDNPRSAEFKSNFLRLKKLVLIGGPNDGVIIPWQSSQFGFYDEQLEVVEMKKQKWYVEDSFGLKTLRNRNAITQHVVPGISHGQWHTNRAVFENYILPYLT